MGAMDEFASNLERGDRSLREGRYAEAERALSAAVALQPRSVKAHFKLGIALERQRKWAAAEDANKGNATSSSAARTFVVLARA